MPPGLTTPGAVGSAAGGRSSASPGAANGENARASLAWGDDQVLAQVRGVFSAASLTLGIFLVGQWQTFAADGHWRAVLILVISIVQLIAGSALMAYGLVRLNRYPTAP